MLKLNRLTHNLLDDLSEFFMSSHHTSADCAVCSMPVFYPVCFFCWIPFRKHLLSNCSWKIGEEVRRKHFCLGYGSHNRMLHSPVSFHALLTLLFFQVIERKYNEWTPWKPAQKYVVVYKDFLSRCLDCTFVEGSRCKYFKNVGKIEAFGLWNHVWY